MEIKVRGIRSMYALGALSVLAMPLAWSCQRSEPLRVEITIPRTVRDQPADGRLLLLLSRNQGNEPRLEMREPRHQISELPVVQPCHQWRCV